MALQTLPAPFPLLSSPGFGGLTTTINAAGESGAGIGELRTSDGGTNKTLSAAGGGVVHWQLSGTPVFADGATVLRVGFQGINPTTGLEDGVWVAYTDLVGGVDPLVTAWNSTPIENGTITIDLFENFVFVVEMTARGGADSIALRRVQLSPTAMFPYGTSDTGSLVVTNSTVNVALTFDDASIGWINGCNPVGATNISSVLTINTSTTPDEIAFVFSVNFRMGIGDLIANLASVASIDDYEFILYGDPEGTPVPIRTLTPNPILQGGVTGAVFYSIPNTIIEPNTLYGLAIRATTVNSIDITYRDLGVGYDFIKLTTAFTAVKLSGRSNQTGPFVEIQTYYLPLFGMSITQLEDGISNSSYAFA